MEKVRVTQKEKEAVDAFKERFLGTRNEQFMRILTTITSTTSDTDYWLSRLPDLVTLSVKQATALMIFPEMVEVYEPLPPAHQFILDEFEDRADDSDMPFDYNDGYKDGILYTLEKLDITIKGVNA